MIDKQKRVFAYRLFQCLVVSNRSLRVEELAELFAIEPKKDTISVYHACFRPDNPEEFILSACSTLVAIVDNRGQRIVQFSHFSVREYLTSDRISNSKHVSHFHVLPRPAHTLFARACLSVLLHLGDHMDRSNIQDFPLALYAAKYWVGHAQVDDVSSDLKHEMRCIFDKNKPHFAAWLRLYDIDHHRLYDDPTTSHRTLPHSQVHPAPLYCAALCGFRDIAEHLIDAHREDVNGLNVRGGTPLHAALYNRHLGVATLLLERGADIESRDFRNLTPLRASLGRIDVMSFLIRRGANLNAEDDTRGTPLHWASLTGKQDAVELLLKHGADPNRLDNDGLTPLYVAYRDFHYQICDLLLNHGANFVVIPRADGGTLLHLASQDGHNRFVSLFLDHGANVNSSNDCGWTPLHFASYKGRGHVVQLLLDRNADVNLSDSDGWTALHLASWQGYGGIVGSLLDRGADAKYPNNSGQTPLHLASQKGYNDIVVSLLDHGADANHSDNQRCTSLHRASQAGLIDTVRLLLDHGADPNHRDIRSPAPICRGHCKIVKYPGNFGWTPLHLASQKGNNDVLVLLLDRGANANHSDIRCQTSLHVASQAGHIDTVRLLLDHGADPKHQDIYGLTPHHIASQEGHDQIVWLLLSHAQGRITGIVMPGLHCVLHRGRVTASSSGYYSIRF